MNKYIETVKSNFYAPAMMFERLRKMYIDSFGVKAEAADDLSEFMLSSLADKYLRKLSFEEKQQIKDSGRRTAHIGGEYYLTDNINTDRSIGEMSLDDIIAVRSCLRTSCNGDYILLHYSQYVYSDPLLRGAKWWTVYGGVIAQCRSVILRFVLDEPVSIASLPFYKFFNLNENEDCTREDIEKLIANAKNVEFSDKLDGSMIQMTHINDKRRNDLIISSSGSLDRDKTFQLGDVYNFTNINKNYADMCHENKEYTFIFEWIAENDKHVVEYGSEKCGLYLIGIRSKTSGDVFSYGKIKEIAGKYNIPTTTVYPATLENVLAGLSDVKASRREGYVLNIDGFLVKIKFEDYIKTAKLSAAMESCQNVAKLLKDGKLDDCLSKLPETVRRKVLKTAEALLEYERGLTEIAGLFAEAVPERENRAVSMPWIEANVPRELKGIVRALVLGKKPDILVRHPDSKEPSYIKKQELEYMSSKFSEWRKIIDELSAHK